MAEINSYNSDILRIFSQKLPWEKLSGSNILITGATGLIGGCLTETLLQNPMQDYSVYVSVRNTDKAKQRFAKILNNNDFHIFKYDVTEKLKLDINFDFIIHTASYANPYFFANNPVEVIKANINGVINLIEYGKQHGLKRFLYVSSGEVYGEGDGQKFVEEFSGYVNCATSRACYPSSKRAAETLCVSYAEEYGIDTVIARPCHVYGPNFKENDNRVYAQFIRNVLNGQNIVMKSDGSQYRSWCYVVDCVSALLYILLKGENKQPYNIADENSNITIKELAETIAELAGRKVVIEMPSNIEKAGYNVVKKSVFSTTKLQSLGWNPKIPIIDGLKNTIEEQKLLH